MTDPQAADHATAAVAPCSGARTADDELRARTYGLLSHLLYTPPDRELLASLATVDSAPAEDETLLAAAWRMLSVAARRAAVEELRHEYQSLFIGVGQGEVVPYGSWYQTGFLMEQPLARLRSDLRALGVERDAGVCEPEDHAAALCAVMALIAAEDAAEDAVDAVEQQRVFFERHIAPWMVRFFRDLQQAPSARFYRSVGQLGERFIEVEQQAFAMSTPPARDLRRANPK